MATDLGEVQKTLWDAADELRANSGLQAFDLFWRRTPRRVDNLLIVVDTDRLCENVSPGGRRNTDERKRTRGNP